MEKKTRTKILLEMGKKNWMQNKNKQKQTQNKTHTTTTTTTATQTAPKQTTVFNILG